MVDQIRLVFDGANSLFLVSLAGLTSNEINDLRANLRKKGARMVVVKNRLARRAAEGSPIALLDADFRGPTAVVHHPGEPASAAKSLFDFAKDHPALKIRAALVDRSTAVRGADVKSVADLPTIDQARAMLLGVMNAPAQTLLRLINTPATQLVYVNKQRSEAADGAAAN
jgi:large subunit ribosomal protein L10